MPSKRQTYPYDPTSSTNVFEGERGIPANPLAALMEAAPGEEPAESWDEKQLRLEPLRDAIDVLLDERERWVIEALFWRQIGLRSIGQELSLSKTHVARIRDEALAKIQYHLEGEYQ